ncbi:MBOAT family O-acyltransferase [Flavobacterium sp.]|uniref:MBOAT family O-acyltransferase n=1 Tax=Flavobacterium sp. TaxID=239 RepID=UPI003B9AFD06
MLFNSFDYALFLPIVFGLYWIRFQNSIKWQNSLLLGASFLFYGFWDYRFLALLGFSTLLDYYCAFKIDREKVLKKRKLWLWVSVGMNLAFLGYFKYVNFFIDSFSQLLENIGFNIGMHSLEIILPVGISFYTFHGLSYIIDVYKERIKPERDIITYALFVSYFPLLVAGPIERATHLLPQLKKSRKFSYDAAIQGFYQIAWGFFKKVVVADQCAVIANAAFDNSENHDSTFLALGAICFAFQIYGDFSGYSDIALGTSKLFGIELIQNFKQPYFSRDIAEFWRRWHLSLSNWFRDYVYIPLGGNRQGKAITIRNTLIVFLLSGFWHGANLTFVFWGLLHAVFYLPLIFLNQTKKHLGVVAENRIIPQVKELFRMSVTFALVCFAWIFFRSSTIRGALFYLERLVTSFESKDNIGWPGNTKLAMILLVVFVFIEWLSRGREHPIFGKYQYQKCVLLLIAILVFGVFTTQTTFIYFQF